MQRPVAIERQMLRRLAELLVDALSFGHASACGSRFEYFADFGMRRIEQDPVRRRGAGFSKEREF